MLMIAVLAQMRPRTDRRSVASSHAKELNLDLTNSRDRNSLFNPSSNLRRESHRCKAFFLFCKCSSVRGMSKLHTGPAFLRGIWFMFVLSMTFLLLSASALLIKDFLNYDVSVYTQLRMDDQTPFPALTVCHQPPYSSEAYRLWNRSELLSPSAYNRYMRQLILKALHENDLDTATSTWGYDSQSVYYQNLAYKDAVRLGHSPAIFLACLQSTQQMLTFDDKCDQIPGYRMRRLSHHLHMNCYTFEPATSEVASHTDHFGLVVGMGPRDSDVTKQQAFFADAFNQARGLRVVVHEVGTLPDVETNGLHVEPGKLTEINYEPHRWTRLNTPKRRCIRSNESHGFRDLESWYNYTYTDCLLVHQQAEIMRHCHCIYAMNPRLELPNESLPYCGQFWPVYNKTEFQKRIDCLSVYLSTEVKRKYDGHPCFPRCNYYEYPSTTSITKWRGQSWQLYWLRVQNQASQQLMAYKEQYPDQNLRNHPAFKQWELYLTYANLTHVPDAAELAEMANGTDIYDQMPKWPPENLELDSDDFTYVVLKRKSSNTIEQNERLVLSLYVLVSRVGGLCSLTIGLTAAFLVELIEFFYLFYRQRKEDRAIRNGEQ